MWDKIEQFYGVTQNCSVLFTHSDFPLNSYISEKKDMNSYSLKIIKPGIN